ncbi:MAG: D-2-hydroxyacid dehydrogenase [Woeseiaceae bacterium]
MPECLIITAVADAFAEEVERLAETPIPVTACKDAKQALEQYSDQQILFGSPAMIAEVLPHMPGIEWIQSSWAGVTPLIEFERRDYVLTGIKDVFGPQMSEYVVGFLLAHELRILERAQMQRERRWTHSVSGTLAGKRLGIMGTGSIGQHIATTAASFGMTVTGLSRSGKSVAGFKKVSAVAQLHDFLENVDYLVSTLPQTSDTDGLLNERALARLPAHAYFINVGRSNVVEDDALIDAVRHARLGGATLDVFDEEPLAEDSPFWSTPNIFVTSHIAAISHPLLIVPIFVDNYIRYSNGQPLKYIVEFDHGY